MTRSWSNQMLYILSPVCREPPYYNSAPPGWAWLPRDYVSSGLLHSLNQEFIRLGCKNTSNIRHNNNGISWGAKYQDTGGKGIQCEILHNVARQFTQNMTYTVLIRDKWWKRMSMMSINTKSTPAYIDTTHWDSMLKMKYRWLCLSC